MTKRGWIVGGVVGLGAVALVGLLAWRTAQVLGVVASGGVDLGVKLDQPVSSARHVTPAAPRPSGGPREDKEGDKPGRAARVDADPTDLLKMAPTRLAIRHDARSAWRQNLSEEELEAVRERVREKQDGMSPEERADREARRQARREAIGLPPEREPAEGDPVEPDPLPDEGLPPEPE